MVAQFTLGHKCLTEFLGMAIVIYTGEAALANELLPNTKGHGMGWGWAVFTFGMSFFLPMQVFGPVSAKLNPAMLMAHLVLRNITFVECLTLSLATVAGAMLGAFLHWLHFLPHYKTVPEPPALNKGDNMLRRRDALTEDALNIASYNTRQERQVKPKKPFQGALYYLRSGNAVEVHTGDEVLENYFMTEGPRKHSTVELMPVGSRALPTHTDKGHRTLARRTIQVADLHNHLAQLHVENVMRQRQCPTCLTDPRHQTTRHSHGSDRGPAPTSGEASRSATDAGCEEDTGPSLKTSSAPLGGSTSDEEEGSTHAKQAAAAAGGRQPRASEQGGRRRYHPHVWGLGAAAASAASAVAGIRRREAKGTPEQQFDRFVTEEQQRAVALYQAALVADRNAKLAIFATRPAIFVPFYNFITEMMGTTMLLLGALLIEVSVYYLPPGEARQIFTTCVQAFLISWMIVVFIAGLGGPTTYAANPARDFGPRLMHQLLPIPNKGSSEWEYAWIPVVAPLVGGVIAAAIYHAMVTLLFPGGLPKE